MRVSQRETQRDDFRFLNETAAGHAWSGRRSFVNVAHFHKEPFASESHRVEFHNRNRYRPSDPNSDFSLAHPVTPLLLL